MILRHVTAGTLLLCLATASFAQDAPRRHKWYVDLGAGEATLDHDEQGFTSLDDTSSSWSFRVGYKFSRFVALEVGYIDIGDFSSMLLPTCGAIGPCSPPIFERTSIDGFLFNSRYIWPIAKHFQLNGSLGMLYHQRQSAVSSSSNMQDAYRDTYENGGFSFGLGIAVPINDHFEIGLDYTQYAELGVAFDFSDNPSIESESDSRVYALDLRYRF
jgi:opacity protein-like surface antigen